MPKSAKSAAAAPTAGSGEAVEAVGAPTSLKDKLFNLRMKINQGRKANKEEVEEEYKRMNNPKHEQKQRYLQKVAEAEGEVVEGAPEGGPKEKKKWSKDGDIMNQTAEQAEFAVEKAQKKKDNMSTFGWQAFTAEATHRAYEKRIKKLPTNLSGRRDGDGDGISHLESNPLDYGKQGASVSQAGLDRVTKDMEDREEAREKYSRYVVTFTSYRTIYNNI
jgi:hypothetical protein